ncbi:MAG TPA: hypothetical protein VN544_10640 [Gaiellaceae bacterium]|nr:hypothetical protein [Gaiellaceae bacterium]
MQARRDELVVERARIDEECSGIDAALAAVGALRARSTNASYGARRPGPRPGARRAPRGANRAKILAAASEPRTVAEIATLTGIRKTVVAATVSPLAKRGVMRRDGAGYRTVTAGVGVRSSASE